ncbi:tetratricopeptide repeat protein [Deinococcus sp. Marseille-Q6407]|uniref:tetratricopeptide repeat protein n=1 Tax=Deinococcus sp. Marseille-Q6407 TaxID=2969223 RepID=UPI0021C189EE|nr:tetratricopeptide repeat protein [Deinococcus sp. Marseille-Q6407]
MIAPTATSGTSRQPAAADPLEAALQQARTDGDRAQVRGLETWRELTSLLRDKRPEGALSKLEAWQKEEARETADTPSPAAPQPAAATELRPPTTAPEVLAALHDPALPDCLRALTAVKRWQTADEAAPALAGALRHPLTRAEAHNLLGVLAAEAGLQAQATEAFARALAADPGHYRALTNRAGLAAEQGDYAAAETDLRRALQLNPDHHAAHQNLAVVLRQQGKRSEAVRAMRRAQRLDYRRSGARNNDQARRELSGLSRVPRAVWIVAGLLLFFGWLWLSGGAGRP